MLGRPKKYDKEFLKWFAENYKNSSDEVIRKIKETYNLDMNIGNLAYLRKRAKKLGYKLEPIVNITQEGVKKWREGNCFKKGTIRKWCDGNYIKTNDGTYRELSRHIYEQHYGKIPRGMCIIHINGDIYDDRIENPAVIKRHVFSYIISSQLYFDNREEFELACLVGELAHKKPHWIRPSRRKKQSVGDD